MLPTRDAPPATDQTKDVVDEVHLESRHCRARHCLVGDLCFAALGAGADTAEPEKPTVTLPITADAPIASGIFLTPAMAEQFHEGSAAINV